MGIERGGGSITGSALKKRGKEDKHMTQENTSYKGDREGEEGGRKRGQGRESEGSQISRCNHDCNSVRWRGEH